MRHYFLLILACLMMVACGTKGPLYLPEKQYPQGGQSAPATKPANDLETAPSSN